MRLTLKTKLSTKFKYLTTSKCLKFAGSAAVHLNVVKPAITPSVHLMNFQFLTPSGDNFRIPLLEPHKLWDNPKFNRKWNTTLVVTGWNSNVNSTNEAVETLSRAYKQRNINFIVSRILTTKNIITLECGLFQTNYCSLSFISQSINHRFLTHPISSIHYILGQRLIRKALVKLSVVLLLSSAM